MAFHYQKVKRYKRGASWSDGTPRMCTRCGAESEPGQRNRRGRAVVTAVLIHDDHRFKCPVGYCEDHIPVILVQDERDPENLGVDEEPEVLVG